MAIVYSFSRSRPFNSSFSTITGITSVSWYGWGGIQCDCQQKKKYRLLHITSRNIASWEVLESTPMYVQYYTSTSLGCCFPLGITETRQRTTWLQIVPQWQIFLDFSPLIIRQVTVEELEGAQKIQLSKATCRSVKIPEHEDGNYSSNSALCHGGQRNLLKSEVFIELSSTSE